MNNEDKIRELFAEKLGNLEAPVNPELWGTISSQIGTVASVTSTGLSLVAKTIIGISAAGVIGVGTYFLTQNSVDEPTQKQEVALNEQKDSTALINVIVDTTPFTPDLSKVYTVDVVINTCGVIPHSEEGDDFPYDMGLEPKSPNDLLENSTFITTPTPNLIGETPKTNTIVPPTKDESRTTKQTVPLVQNEDIAVTPVKSVLSSFEITRLPNVYVLNANGYFSIDYKGEYTDFQITMMDSRNKVIFSSDHPDFEWRGIDMSGNQIEPGKYVYIITVKDVNGNAVNKYSPLTVMNQ